MATIFLMVDSMTFYAFCQYYRKLVNGTLNRLRLSMTDDEIWKTIHKQHLKRANENNNDSDVGSMETDNTSTSNGSTSNVVVTSQENILELEFEREKGRQIATIKRTQTKLSKIYNGLLRQFYVTLIAITVCGIDLVINTIGQNYNLLFFFMIDTCVVVSVNFLAFRDSQEFVLSKFHIFLDRFCQFCAFCSDICCCMMEFPGTKNSTINAIQTKDNKNCDEWENQDGSESFIRYSLKDYIGE